MKRLPKFITITLCAVIALCVVVLLALNLYLQSPATQARIEEELSKALRLPLRVTNTSFTPWSDLQIRGISVPTGTDTPEFLTAERFSARYRLGPLLERRLEIYDVRMEKPHIVWRADANGKWALPTREEVGKTVETAANKVAASSTEKKTAPAAPGGTSPNASASPTAAANTSASAEKSGAKPKKEPSQSRLTVKVEGITLVNGSLEILDKDGVLMAQATGVDIQMEKLDKDALLGMVSAKTVSMQNVWAFENLNCRVEYTAPNLRVTQLNANFHGGKVTGQYSQRTDWKYKPFIASLTLEKVDLALLIAAAGQPGTAGGMLKGKIEARGSAADFLSASGPGWLELENGWARKQHLEWLRLVGDLLRIREFSEVRLTKARVDFRLDDEKALVDGLLLETEDMRLFSQGSTGFTKKLNLPSRLTLSQRYASLLPEMIRPRFKTSTPEGGAAIDFNITGKPTALKTDLDEILLGKKELTQRLEDLVSNLLGKDKKSKSDDRKRVDSQN